MVELTRFIVTYETTTGEQETIVEACMAEVVEGGVHLRDKEGRLLAAFRNYISVRSA